MRAGFVGLGAVVETAWIPALKRSSLSFEQIYGFDTHAGREVAGVTRCDSLEALLSKSLDYVLITTASLAHLPVLEQVIRSDVPRIVVEKPVAATLPQLAHLQQLLAEPGVAGRVLALDHWMARDGIRQLAQGSLHNDWVAQGTYPVLTPQISALHDIVKIEGFLQEPSGFNEQGEPVALNFATGQPDTRHLQHPDGVIVDIGTHVLAMIRETLVSLGADESLSLDLLKAVDRLGESIKTGDFTTAEGEAHLQGHLGGIPLEVWLNKYAGPAGGQKGIRLHLRNGAMLSLDRAGADDVLELHRETDIRRWTLTGAVYDRCLKQEIFGAGNLFERAPEQIAPLTQRRIAEVTCLLQLQQQLRGPH